MNGTNAIPTTRLPGKGEKFPDGCTKGDHWWSFQFQVLVKQTGTTVYPSGRVEEWSGEERKDFSLGGPPETLLDHPEAKKILAGGGTIPAMFTEVHQPTGWKGDFKYFWKHPNDLPGMIAAGLLCGAVGMGVGLIAQVGLMIFGVLPHYSPYAAFGAPLLVPALLGIGWGGWEMAKTAIPVLSQRHGVIKEEAGSSCSSRRALIFVPDEGEPIPLDPSSPPIETIAIQPLSEKMGELPNLEVVTVGGGSHGH